jgi:hypothetical protein
MVARPTLASFAPLALAAGVLIGRPGCRFRREAPAPVASVPPTFVPMMPAPSSGDASTPVNANASVSTSPNTAALDRSRQWLEAIRWTVEHKATVNPDRAGEGDAASQCDAVADARAGVGSDADAAYRNNLDDAAGLCAFDVRLVTASEALDRLRYSPSQASRLLQCNVARREIEEARKVSEQHPKDARLRQLDARRGSLCHE